MKDRGLGSTRTKSTEYGGIVIRRKIRELPAKLTRSNVEEEVKAAFCAAFDLDLDAGSMIDLYTSQVLFEFKYQKNLANLTQRAKIIAQTMYYVRRLKFGQDSRSIPPWIGVVDMDEGFFVRTKAYKALYSSAQYDWDRAPSTPDPRLVEAVANLDETQTVHVYKFSNAQEYDHYINKITPLLSEQGTLDLFESDKKVINEQTFLDAFSLWEDLFGEYVQNGTKSSEFFIADIREGGSTIWPGTSDVAFDISSESGLKRKSMPLVEYGYFWDTYEKIKDNRQVVSIRQRFDRMTVENVRRFTGEFYTPVEFAEKALEYIARTVGDRWWEKGYRLWDMAAGTGNLEYKLPEEALPYTYISTILEDDANYCKALYPTAKVFTYDYLNDDVDVLFDNPLNVGRSDLQTSMPQQLFDDLRDPSLKWIIFINPPFATANVGARTSDISKDNVSKTRIRTLMTRENMGETSRELFSQFLYRIDREFRGRTAYLGMFSKIKYINANNDQGMRDAFFRYKFRGGFCFPSTAFQGNKGSFPVGFLVWQINSPVALELQQIKVDIFTEMVEKVGTKIIPTGHRADYLSKWVPRPRTGPDPWPPLSSALSVAPGNTDVRNRVAPGFLASLMAKGNEMANQNYTAIFSSPYVSAGAFSVVPENFERAMILHTTRRLPRATWLNDRDPFMAPVTNDFDDDFVTDCVVWSLFSDSNGAASMKGVQYGGRIYQIHNHLYPFPLEKVKGWEPSLSALRDGLSSANQDRFGANWLGGRQLSAEATAVMSSAEDVYKEFYRQSSSLRHAHWKIALWDVGWHQIRLSLNESDLATKAMAATKAAHRRLGAKLLPLLSNYGFLPAEEHIFAVEEGLI